MRRDIQKADFEYLKSQVAAGVCDAQGDHPSPTMLHFRGGRAGISREAYPSSSPTSTTTSPRPMATSCSRLRRRLPLRADGRHQPRLPVRREDARGGASSAATTPTSCRTATPGSSTRWWPKPKGMTLAMHLCRGNFKSTFAPPRATTSRWPRRCCPEMNRTPTSWSTTTTARRLPPAALPAQRQDRRAGPGHHQVRPAREEGRPQAPHRRGFQHAPLEQLACRRSAASPAPCTATTSRWKTSAGSWRWWWRRRARSGAEPALSPARAGRPWPAARRAARARPARARQRLLFHRRGGSSAR